MFEQSIARQKYCNNEKIDFEYSNEKQYYDCSLQTLTKIYINYFAFEALHRSIMEWHYDIPNKN